MISIPRGEGPASLEGVDGILTQVTSRTATFTKEPCVISIY